MARTAKNKGADQMTMDTNPQKDIITPLQAKIDDWVKSGYPGVSDLSRRLLTYWFGGPHPLADGKGFFLWHPHQRRAVETTIYLYEVEKLRRTEQYAELVNETRAAQKAPWAKIGLQMATGSGKTKVMSLLMVWVHLHWQLGDTGGDPTLGFGNTQLLLAPNLIVLERLLADFAPGKESQANIFALDPLLPPDLRNEFSLQVVTPGSIPAEWQPSEGYLVVANIQKLFIESEGKKDAEPIPEDDSMFDLFNPDTGGLPTKLDTGAPRLLDFMQSVQSPVLVFNDEAHHVHDEAVHYGKAAAAALKDEDIRNGIAWNRVLTGIQKRQGLSLQIDLSATLFEEASKQWFKHTVYDYPLQQAIREGIVKKPFMGKVSVQFKDGHDESISLVDDSATNAFDKYTHLIQAGIAEWKKEQKALDTAGIARKALLFIVCKDKTEAAQIATRLEEFPDADTGECLFADKVIEIHIGRKEATNEKEWQKVREAINRVDSSDSPYTAIVSVMMLKEGWDVKNVKVIVPLRACDSRQLTEQLLGRGLRRMFPPSWTAEGERRDGRAESLYVIRHPSFERIIKNISDIIEDEPEDGKRPNPSRVLVKMAEPEEEREKRDLPISIIVGEPYDLDDDWIDKIGRGQMPPLAHKFAYMQDVKEMQGEIRHEGAVGTETLAEAPLKYDVQTTGYSSIDALITEYAGHIRAELRLTGSYTPAIKGIVKSFLERCTFDLRGIPLSLEAAADYDDDTRKIVIANIRRDNVKLQVIQNVAKIIGQARAGKETPDVEVKTRYARDLTEYEASPTQNMMENPAKSVHTLCCFDSGDELKFAQMLDEADDVASWLWNDQSGVGFRIQYSFEGRMPYYYPDFLVRLTDGSLYIIESKGSIRERDRAKQSRAERYADILREATGEEWRYIFLVNDSSIGRTDMAWWRQQGRTMFRDLVKHTQNAATGAGMF